MSYSDLTTKTSKVEFIRGKMETNYAWASRGLVRIYEYQTEAEQSCGNTSEYNGVGFTGVDGEILSSFAEQVIKGRKLSDKQQHFLFKKMPKYARQLMKITEAVQ